MWKYQQERIYDEDLAIDLIDSSTVEVIASILVALNLKYQDALDLFISLDEPTYEDIENLDNISKELNTYRKALQILVG